MQVGMARSHLVRRIVYFDKHRDRADRRFAEMRLPILRSVLDNVASGLFFPFRSTAFERWAIPKSRSHLICFMALFFFFVAAFSFMAAVIARDVLVSFRLSSSGLATVATIREAAVHERKRSPKFHTTMSYTFNGKDGIEYAGRMLRELKSHPPQFARGTELKVIYDPEWPALNAPVLELEDIASRNNTFGSAFFGIGALWLGLSAFRCGMHLRRRRGQWHV